MNSTMAPVNGCKRSLSTGVHGSTYTFNVACTCSGHMCNTIHFDDTTGEIDRDLNAGGSSIMQIPTTAAATIVTGLTVSNVLTASTSDRS